MKNDLILYIQIGLLPLIITNILHMLIVKYNICGWLNKPLSISLFGKNKTWRGLIFIPLLNIPIVLCSISFFEVANINPILIGFLLGFAYVLFELPNSYIKRRMGIAPGETHPTKKIFFKSMDKIDSAFGVALMYYLLGFTGILTTLFLFIFNSSVHIILSFILVRLRIKKNF